METSSPFLLVRELEMQLKGRLTAIDLYDLPVAEQAVLTGLQHELTDARLDIRDYELSETRAAQLGCARSARERLEKVQKAILAASEHNVFGAADVAQLTSQIEHIIEQIN